MPVLARDTLESAVASINAVDTLRQVNGKLRSALNAMRPEKRRTSSVRAQEFTSLRQLLEQAASVLRSVVRNSSGAVLSDDAVALENEKLVYLQNLEKLKRLLPDVHARILRERSRLETARSQLNAAAAWAKARREACEAERSPQP